MICPLCICPIFCVSIIVGCYLLQIRSKKKILILLCNRRVLEPPPPPLQVQIVKFESSPYVLKIFCYNLLRIFGGNHILFSCRLDQCIQFGPICKSFFFTTTASFTSVSFTSLSLQSESFLVFLLLPFCDHIYILFFLQMLTSHYKVLICVFLFLFIMSLILLTLHLIFILTIGIKPEINFWCIFYVHKHLKCWNCKFKQNVKFFANITLLLYRIFVFQINHVIHHLITNQLLIASNICIIWKHKHKHFQFVMRT